MSDESAAEASEPSPPRPAIPKILHSAYSSTPFETCVDCGSSLLHPPRRYQIAKAFNGSECIFEAAVCFQCGDGLKSEMSEESLQNLSTYLRELTSQREPSPHGASWQHCSFCHKELAGSHQLMAVMFGPIQLTPPVTMCHDCAAPVEERLSEKTREGWQKFIDSNFPGVPANFDLPVLF